MATRRKKLIKKEITVLTKSKIIFEKELAERIEIGERITEDRIENDKAFNNAEKQYSEWTDYNLELLKQSFNIPTNEYWRKYDSCTKTVGLTIAIINGEQPKPNQKLINFLKRVELKLDNLKKLKNKVNLLKSDFIEESKSSNNLIEPNSENNMKIFISHSHKDVNLAKALIELIRNALNLKAEDIRCTSVDGYRLRAGVSTDEQLKTEIYNSEVLIGLISPSSISSYYVLFELGARWGANKPLIPLITNEQGSNLLKGPLKGINALNTNSESQLFQLISDLSELLNISSEKASVYQTYINQLSKLVSSESSLTESKTDTNSDSILENSDYSDSDKKIKTYCKGYWPDDYSMQVSCINEQREAVEILKKGKPDDISADDFVLIRKKASEYWKNDYTMRLSQEKEQFDAIRKLRDI